MINRENERIGDVLGIESSTVGMIVSRIDYAVERASDDEQLARTTAEIVRG
jgi:hypothetical protein